MSHEDEEHPTLTVELPPDPVRPHDATITEAGEAPSKIAPARTGVRRRERITLRGLHSSGGTGEVWRAYDEILEREVALKQLRPEHAALETSRARFFREAQITGQLDHPGIVPVYDYSAGKDGTHSFYTMRFLRGRTLSEVTAEFHGAREHSNTPLVCAAFLSLLQAFVSVCNTVAFAHSREVIHRDLKGDNVIIGDFGEVVVLDWGLAKRLSEGEHPEPGGPEGVQAPDKTQQGARMGTPAYMAPEQALGDIAAIDARTDIYGLAAILYEILTGDPPFAGEQAGDIMRQVVEREPTPPRKLVPEVPIELQQACLKGLAKNMDRRQQQVGELTAAVQGWLTALAERKRTEQERERFFDLSTDLLAILDRRGHFVQTNAAWDTLLGWPDHERKTTAFTVLVAEADRAAADRALSRIWFDAGESSEASLEIRMRHQHGGERWVDWSVRRLPEDAGLYLVGRDVSERRRHEQEFRGLIESAPDAMCVIDEHGTIVIVNAQLERMFGYPREQLLGGPVEQLVPKAIRERHVGYVRRYVANPKARPMGSGLELRGERRDGSVFPVEISLSPVQTDEQLLVSCTLRDTSERRKLERRMMAVLEAAPDAMIVVDDDQNIAIANRQVEELFGYPRSELVGRPLDTLIPARFHAAHVEHMRRYFSDPKPRSMGAGQVLRGRHKDGREFPVEISLSPVETEDGVLVCSAIRRAEDDAS